MQMYRKQKHRTSDEKGGQQTKKARSTIEN